MALQLALALHLPSDLNSNQDDVNNQELGCSLVWVKGNCEEQMDKPHVQKDQDSIKAKTDEVITIEDDNEVDQSTELEESKPNSSGFKDDLKKKILERQKAEEAAKAMMKLLGSNDDLNNAVTKTRPIAKRKDTVKSLLESKKRRMSKTLELKQVKKVDEHVIDLVEDENDVTVKNDNKMKTEVSETTVAGLPLKTSKKSGQSSIRASQDGKPVESLVSSSNGASKIVTGVTGQKFIRSTITGKLMPAVAIDWTSIKTNKAMIESYFNSLKQGHDKAVDPENGKKLEEQVINSVDNEGDFRLDNPKMKTVRIIGNEIQNSRPQKPSALSNMNADKKTGQIIIVEGQDRRLGKIESYSTASDSDPTTANVKKVINYAVTDEMMSKQNIVAFQQKPCIYSFKQAVDTSFLLESSDIRQATASSEASQQLNQAISFQRSDSTDYKEDLKRKIFERRKAEGKTMIDLAEEEEKRKRNLEDLNELSQIDIERRQRLRKNNNMAARRCRENNKNKRRQMEKEIAVQRQRNKELHEAFKFLHAEKEMLQKLWQEVYSPGSVSRNPGLVAAVRNMVDKDYEKFIPKPLPRLDLGLENENSAASSGDEKVDNSKRKEMIQQNSGHQSISNKVVCSTLGSDHPNGKSEKFETNEFSDRMKSEFSKQNEFAFIDLTENNAASSWCVVSKVNNTKKIVDLTDDCNNSADLNEGTSLRLSVSEGTSKSIPDKVEARAMLFEAAEAAYCEMNDVEEITLSNMDSSSQESLGMEEVTSSQESAVTESQSESNWQESVEMDEGFHSQESSVSGAQPNSQESIEVDEGFNSQDSSVSESQLNSQEVEMDEGMNSQNSVVSEDQSNSQESVVSEGRANNYSNLMIDDDDDDDIVPLVIDFESEGKEAM